MRPGVPTTIVNPLISFCRSSFTLVPPVMRPTEMTCDDVQSSAHGLFFLRLLLSVLGIVRLTSCCLYKKLILSLTRLLLFTCSHNRCRTECVCTHSSLVGAINNATVQLACLVLWVIIECKIGTQNDNVLPEPVRACARMS